jgi:cytochrome c peroxidase
MTTRARYRRTLGGASFVALTAVLVWSLVPIEMLAETKPTLLPNMAALEEANPLLPLPQTPLGIPGKLSELDDAPTPESVRLGRWLFFDPRLSIDETVSCATCHRPPHGYSEPTPVSSGVKGKTGNRKAPPVLNLAFNIEPHQFWDGRAATLEEQAVGPMINPVEMAMPNHDIVVERIRGAKDYAPFFAQAFGSEEINIERIGKAIADYERTRLSGNSPWDRWRAEPDPEDAKIDIDAATDFEGNVQLGEIDFTDGKHVSAEVKLGHYVFFEKAFCNQCHLGPTLTDSQFHNLGVGWNAETKSFADKGRFVVTKQEEDIGAFKTPTLREVSRHGPYMHDGSVETLREVVELYARGGEQNPTLSPKVFKLDLTEREIDAVVAFMEALDGEGYLDRPPTAFPGGSARIAQAAAMATCGCQGQGHGPGPCAGRASASDARGCCKGRMGATADGHPCQHRRSGSDSEAGQ